MNRWMYNSFGLRSSNSLPHEWNPFTIYPPTDPTGWLGLGLFRFYLYHGWFPVPPLHPQNMRTQQIESETKLVHPGNKYCCFPSHFDYQSRIFLKKLGFHSFLVYSSSEWESQGERRLDSCAIDVLPMDLDVKVGVSQNTYLCIYYIPLYPRWRITDPTSNPSIQAWHYITAKPPSNDWMNMENYVMWSIYYGKRDQILHYEMDDWKWSLWLYVAVSLLKWWIISFPLSQNSQITTCDNSEEQ